MQVKVKEFNVDMAVKSRGIEFEIRAPDDSSQHGDCYLTMTGLIWCKGKTKKENGMTIMQSEEARKTAVKAAKRA